MTIDEAIKHAEEVADSDCYNDKQFKCANEHRQLAEWLKDYKRMLEQEPCEDAISRADVLDLCDSEYDDYRVWHFKEDVECLPSVRPTRPRGKWITKWIDSQGSDWWINPKCSICGEDPPSKHSIFEYRFCPYCGCQMDTDMRESEDGTNEMQ